MELYSFLASCDAHVKAQFSELQPRVEPTCLNGLANIKLRYDAAYKGYNTAGSKQNLEIVLSIEGRIHLLHTRILQFSGLPMQC
jgi:hypothetical protein